jgi:excisionase family DNA binding protein
MGNFEEWITTRRAADLTGYTITHIRLLIRHGEIVGQKWGRDWQVNRDSLMSYLVKSKALGEKRGPKPEK